MCAAAVATLKVSDLQFQRCVNDLSQFVAIPSLSDTRNAEYNLDNLYRAAQFAGSRFRELGFHVENIAMEEGAQPYVLAKKVVDAALPTIVLYGHYDVQPVVREKWNTDPFVLVEINGRLYGRGASDDKAGIEVILTAMKVRQEAGVKLPVNVTVFLEGEEEFRSLHMGAFLNKHGHLLESAQAMVIMDGINRDDQTGNLDSCTRGLANLEVVVRALHQPVHSGLGCLAPDPAMALCALLFSLADPTQIPGYMESCEALTADGIALLDRSTITPEAYARGNEVIEGVSLRGDPAKTIFRRIMDQPSISIVNMTSGEEGGSASIQDIARATVGLRFTGGQNPEQALQAIVNHLRSQTVLWNLPVTIDTSVIGAAWKADLDGAYTQCYLSALAENFPQSGVLPIGGTIPLFGQFREAFPHMEMLLVGVEDDQTKGHSHNESQGKEVLRHSINALNAFLDRAAHVPMRV